MSAIEPLFSWFGFKQHKLSREEIIILESALLHIICEGVKENFRKKYKEYFCLMKLTKKMENVMLEENYIRFMIRDILSTKEYTLEGIAYYMDTHEDVIHEMVSGINLNPSAKLLRRTIELHRSVRSELYATIIKRMIKELTDPSVNHDA